MGTTTHAPMPSNPVHAVIAAHRAAWDAFQIAPVGEHSKRAEAFMEAALEAILSTGCETQHGAICLLTHLRWWLTEERDFADSYQPSYDIALARGSDLAMLLGGSLWPTAVAADSELETTPARLGSIAAGIVRRLGCRIPLNGTVMGELLAATAIITGGMAVIGLVTLL
ncbi:hypothetical protein MKK69_20415 [Methylobacterium sp. J-026]|uniref:hypothetical protein n=1 Tax=Methylobacterium sp. J-026 TaxID=2836624 RepID=UPI001FB96F84|nr:hypothetical protein [Methylobacterium sp. J-026]MCJ2136384.1 hypothetical protein [Methylobacterium sp. J-026]